MRRRGLTSSTRQAVRDRAGNRCEACGNPLNDLWECHHRRFRSQRGTNEIPNLAALCQPCHIRAHSDRKWGEYRGLVVPSWQAWVRVPMILWDDRTVFLSSDGAYNVLPEDGAA